MARVWSGDRGGFGNGWYKAVGCIDVCCEADKGVVGCRCESTVEPGIAGEHDAEKGCLVPDHRDAAVQRVIGKKHRLELKERGAR